jgi:hypothetical protein
MKNTMERLPGKNTEQNTKGSYRELRGVLIKDSESFRVRWRVFF